MDPNLAGWHDGACDECGRETRVTPLSNATATTQVCLVCLDALAEAEAEAAVATPEADP